MATLGVEIEGIEPGRVELIVPYRSDFAQQHGFMHAGIITTVLDTACGYAAFTLMPREAAVLTVELKTNLLSPGKGEKFRLVGKVVKPGRTLTFCEGAAYAINGSETKLVSTMTATMMAVTGRDDIKG